jgi:DNA-binding transcriptional ArsR family regulator
MDQQDSEIAEQLAEAMKQRALRVRPPEAIEEPLRKALTHNVRIQILWILNERAASASELAADLSCGLNTITGHLKVLKEAGCVEVVDEVVRGNAVQRFYKASAQVFLDSVEWPKIPPTVQLGMRVVLLQNLMDDAVEAVAHGTFDSRDESHMSWTPMIIDEEGREELTEILTRALNEALALQKRADERLAAGDETGFCYSVSILGYPSIGGYRKVHPAKDAERPPSSSPSPSAKSTKRRKSNEAKTSAKKGRTSKAMKAPASGRATSRIPKRNP